MGIQHQAGSDSLVTAKLFFKIKESYFKEYLSPAYHNVLHGLGSNDGQQYMPEYELAPGYYLSDYMDGYSEYPLTSFYPHIGNGHQMYGEYSAEGEVLDYL